MLSSYLGKCPKDNDCADNGCDYLAKPTEGVEPELMREVSSLLAEGEMTSSEVASLLDESENPIVNELAYFLTHDVVVIDRIAGGHRGAIPNDT